jgi:hypothetical protein
MARPHAFTICSSPPQMGVEEGDDAAAGVLIRRLVVAGPRDPAQQHRQRRHVRGRVVVEEPMTGLGIDLMSWATPLAVSARSGRPAARYPSGSGPAAIAGHDRTRPSQDPLGVLGAAAIVGAGGREAAARGQGQGMAAAHADPITPIRPVHWSWPASQVRAASRSSKVRPWRVPSSRMMVRRQRSMLPPPVQVGGGGQVARGGDPVGLVAQVLAHPAEIVDHHHDRPRPPGQSGWPHRSAAPRAG